MASLFIGYIHQYFSFILIVVINRCVSRLLLSVGVFGRVTHIYNDTQNAGVGNDDCIL